ncbi:hypothetical protein [Nocardiopsis lambiniae]|uniref:Roadblock/LC7 domain-containing protein n=1 Tax=Nocardiopsis lambiniae TaxID=3075539 RepID=A0ABU2MF96_9ACTN|nr:hypothetical protein [Nocardiopsis sp. DSM 44743]MDT0331239.1 hypothetical protein [Nocardiopsis sp. DSM 44743]
MINNRIGRVALRHERPALVGELLTDFQGRTGAAHTVAFGLDGVLLGHAGHPEDERAQVRAEQSASSSYMLASLCTGVAATWPAERRPAGPVHADHLLLRHRAGIDPQTGERPSPWWVLVVPVPDWGGLVTELPPDREAPVASVMGDLLECADRIRGVLADAHRKAG